jgi:hypothetical protein
MTVHCQCGSTFWAEPPLTSCPECDEAALVPWSGESREDFAERTASYLRTVTEIRALAEAPAPRRRFSSRVLRSAGRIGGPVRLLVTVATLAAFVIAAVCGTTGTRHLTPPSGAAAPTPPARLHGEAAPTPPARLHGEAARAAGAVAVLGRALRNGRVERLCEPGAVFTPAVIAAMNEGGRSCEASLEASTELRRPPALTVTKLAYEPGLATARVGVGRGSTFPLDIVRRGPRWLVSFSNGTDPLVALQRAMISVSG